MNKALVLSLLGLTCIQSSLYSMNDGGKGPVIIQQGIPPKGFRPTPPAVPVKPSTMDDQNEEEIIDTAPTNGKHQSDKDKRKSLLDIAPLNDQVTESRRNLITINVEIEGIEKEIDYLTKDFDKATDNTEKTRLRSDIKYLNNQLRIKKNEREAELVHYEYIRNGYTFDWLIGAIRAHETVLFASATTLTLAAAVSAYVYYTKFRKSVSATTLPAKKAKLA